MSAGAVYPDLAGRCVLITGAAAGIGLAMARAFARQGARLVLLDMNEAVLEVAQALPNAAGVVGSVADAGDVTRAFDAADEHFGGVDVAIANAGVSMNVPTLDLSPDAWRRALDVNLTGTFLTAQEAGRRMIPHGRGVILLMASMYGVVAAPERLGYCVSKSGVVMMAKALALEWARHGIRVNGLAPGYVRTALVEDLAARGRLDVARLEARTPIGRLIAPEEVAEAALFLASDTAGAVAGQILGVDGGWAVNGYL